MTNRCYKKSLKRELKNLFPKFKVLSSLTGENRKDKILSEPVGDTEVLFLIYVGDISILSRLNL